MDSFKEEMVSLEELAQPPHEPEEIISLDQLKKKKRDNAGQFRKFVYISEAALFALAFLLMLLLPQIFTGLILFIPFLFGPYFYLGLVAFAVAPKRKPLFPILFIIFNGIASVLTLLAFRDFNFY